MNRTSAVQITRDLKYCLGTNTLGIIVFSLTFGVLLSTIGPKGQIVIDFFDAIFEVSKKMVTCVIWLAPICISSAIAGKILTVDNLPFLISQLMWFIATVVIGMFINQWILIQLIYYFVLRKSPFKFYFKLMEPLLTGAATASRYRFMQKLIVNLNATKYILTFFQCCNTSANFSLSERRSWDRH